MGNSLRLKLAVLIIGSAVLIAISAIRTNMFTAGEWIRYKQLAWENFAGVPELFEKHDAGLTSKIFIEYDSAQKSYVAYSAMHNTLSYVKGKEIQSENLLKHEQYHFNLTEYHAQALNDQINKRGLNNKPKAIRQLLEESNKKLQIDQTNYDKYTSHNLNQPQQHLWEWRIDSLLSIYQKDSTFYTDWFSGLSIYLPSHYTSSIQEFDDGLGISKRIVSKNYGITVSIYTARTLNKSIQLSKEQVTNHYADDSIRFIDHLNPIEFNDASIVFERVNKDIAEHNLAMWLKKDDLLITISLIYPNNRSRDFYRTRSLNILKNVRFNNTTSYWDEIGKSLLNNRDIHGTTSDTTSIQINSMCNEPKLGLWGRVHKPIFINDTIFIIPYQNLSHPSQYLKKLLLVLNEEVQTSIPTNQPYQIFIGNLDMVKTGPKIDVTLGYFIEPDSNKKCYSLFLDTLSIVRETI
jgi:hypothetical protein